MSELAAHRRGAALPLARAGRARGARRGVRGRRRGRRLGARRAARGVRRGRARAGPPGGRRRLDARHRPARRARRPPAAGQAAHPAADARAGRDAAIVAYLQPVSRPEIARIRGVASDSATATLLERGLIEESGRSQFGAVLYRTTPLFLKLFGLDASTTLPDPAQWDPSPEEQAELRDRLLRAGEARAGVAAVDHRAGDEARPPRRVRAGRPRRRASLRGDPEPARATRALAAATAEHARPSRRLARSRAGGDRVATWPAHGRGEAVERRERPSAHERTAASARCGAEHVRRRIRARLAVSRARPGSARRPAALDAPASQPSASSEAARPLDASAAEEVRRDRRTQRRGRARSRRASAHGRRRSRPVQRCAQPRPPTRIESATSGAQGPT